MHDLATISWIIPISFIHPWMNESLCNESPWMNESHDSDIIHSYHSFMNGCITWSREWITSQWFVNESHRNDSWMNRFAMYHHEWITSHDVIHSCIIDESHCNDSWMNHCDVIHPRSHMIHERLSSQWSPRMNHIIRMCVVASQSITAHHWLTPMCIGTSQWMHHSAMHRIASHHIAMHHIASHHITDSFRCVSWYHHEWVTSFWCVVTSVMCSNISDV